MDRRIDLVPVEEAVRIGREIGIAEVQASRGAFRTLSHSPDVARHIYGLITTLLNRNKLDVRLRELMVMRIAWTTGSEYEWFQHYRIATTQARLTEEEILAVCEWRKSERFGPADRAVLAAVDDTVTGGKISDGVWAECARHIVEPALLVEMVVAIGNWIMFSQITQSLQIPIPEGAIPWPPDGIGPQTN